MATRSFPEVEDEILTAVQGCYEGGTAQVGGFESLGLERLAQTATAEQRAAGLGAEWGMPPLRPRRRAAVMLVGNHSAGKSSLANFLAGAHVQEESAPIETRGFTLITGASSDWGAAHTLLPQDRGLCEQFAGVVRVQGRLALEQCPHVFSALAAAPPREAYSSDVSPDRASAH
ncbi:hypothetical protein FNF27_06054 [Cafeteria roenbergensis]|uniref:G domain-containing protein n=1 Tax=Cafeteria roenbergensis TaxID=33653 RepID=A0A5A8E9E7_CAFRO|nr:hypothetical protein FNF27_06054 [Cafeteria roenbergensis]